MMKPYLNGVCLTAFLGLLAACERDDTIPVPPPFPVEETVVPASLCEPVQPRLPGQALTQDLQDPAPGIPTSGTPESDPLSSDFPTLPDAPQGAVTFGWVGLTPCNQLLPGAYVPPEAAAATGRVAVQTNPTIPTISGHRLVIQVKNLPPEILYQPWLAARAADGRYLFVSLSPFRAAATDTAIVRPVSDPLLNADGVAGYPVAITSNGLQAGAAITDAARAFPLHAFRYWFITRVPENDLPLAAQPTVVLSGAAEFPVPQLRTGREAL